MSEYDSSKDKLLWGRDDVFKSEYSRLSVDIFQYDGKGKPKLQITREKFDKEKNDWEFVKLGRMTLEEFSAVARAAKEGFAAVESGAQGTKPAAGWQ